MQTLFGVETKPEIIHALWWNQPYASLMLPPHNKIETRTRPTKVRGKVLICVCKNPYNIAMIDAISGHEQYMRIVNSGLSGHVFHHDNLGQAIAIGELVDCRPMTKEDEDKCFVAYQGYRYCWVFENVQPIEPFPMKGKQGWAILTQEQKAMIKIIK